MITLGEAGGSWIKSNGKLLYCDQSKNMSNLDIILDSIVTKPTHYSLRYGTCYGMSDWDFQASTDGNSWVTLHKARGDNSIRMPTEEKQKEIDAYFIERCKGVSDAEAKRTIATAVVEDELRHTWAVSASQFFSHFRIVGGGGSRYDDGCMHGVGFELYGEVKEKV